MPHIETIENPSLTDLTVAVLASAEPGKQSFYSAMSAALQKHNIRSRNLVAEGGKLCGLQVEIAPQDSPRLGLAFAEVREAGYRMVQTVKVGDELYRAVFARLVESEIETAVLEIRLERKGGSRKPAFRGKIRGTGAFLVFLGPDGVGKTTLLREVCAALKPIFAAQELYRWRPGRILPTHHSFRLPHSKPLRSLPRSISYLFFSWADFVSGYLTKTRRLMDTPTLVVFDRYYHDLLIDPKRYRYKGPMWLANIIGKLVPPRDAFFLVLDADEQAIFNRKQQLAIEEIRRQRASYRQFAGGHDNRVLIETDQPLPQCRERALEALLHHLEAKNQRLVSRWFHFPTQSASQLDRRPGASIQPPPIPAAGATKDPVLDPTV